MLVGEPANEDQAVFANIEAVGIGISKCLYSVAEVIEDTPPPFFLLVLKLWCAPVVPPKCFLCVFFRILVGLTLNRMLYFLADVGAFTFAVRQVCKSEVPVRIS